MSEQEIVTTTPTKPQPQVYRLDLLLDQFDTAAEKIEIAKLTDRPMGPVTGFSDLDSNLAGCLQPGLHVLCGNTGAGKSAFALQIACQCQFPALYVSCEQSALEQFRRVIARITETPRHQLVNPKCALPAVEMKKRARAALEAAPELVIADATLAYAEPAWIRDQAALLKEATGAENLLIVIDSLHSWAAWQQAEEYERLGMALGHLRAIAAELSCPVLCISEQSKTANRENAKGRDFGASAPAGFRGIEYGAETVIGLLVATDNGEPIADAYGEYEVTARLHKNRNGSPGKPIQLKFAGAFMTFREV